jgi:hypothetical protein
MRPFGFGFRIQFVGGGGGATRALGFGLVPGVGVTLRPTTFALCSVYCSPQVLGIAVEYGTILLVVV